MRIDVEPAVLIHINAPEWFKRDDFQTFLNSSGVATWHRQGEPPNECSDVFVTFDHGEGSNAPCVEAPDVLPEDIWDTICEALEEQGIVYGLIWIKNLGGCDGC